MKVTVDSLKRKQACKSAIVKFKEKFPDGVDIWELIKYLEKIEDCNNYIDWLFVKYNLSGICKGWDDNGQLRCKDNYKNGKQHGLCKGWDDNGNLMYEYNYKNGEIIKTRRQTMKVSNKTGVEVGYTLACICTLGIAWLVKCVISKAIKDALENEKKI